MTRYRLAAYLSITGHSPAFLIPVFRRRGSNILYAQEVTAGGRVSKFVRINTESYRILKKSGATQWVEPNDPAVVSVHLTKDGVFSGSYSTIKELVRKLNLDDLPPFFAVEAAFFSGRVRDLDLALERASKVFQDAELRDRWLSQSRRGLSVPGVHGELLGTAPNDLLAALSKLRSIKSPSGWLREWRAQWRHFPNRQALFDEAIKWLLSRSMDKHFTRLLILILMYGRGRDDVLDLATYALSTLPTTERLWPYLWSRVMVNWQTPALIGLGLQFLGSSQFRLPTPDSEVLSSECEIGLWIRVWKRLLRYPDITERLVALASEQEVRWSMSERFQREILKRPELRINRSFERLRKAIQ